MYQQRGGQFREPLYNYVIHKGFLDGFQFETLSTIDVLAGERRSQYNYIVKSFTKAFLQPIETTFPSIQRLVTLQKIENDGPRKP